VDFSCFGYHPNLESRLTIQEKWVLGRQSRPPEPSDMKQMFRTYLGLLWSDLQVGLLLGVLKPPAENEMKLFSEQAAREFLAIYGI
jgi:hypothetical protein